MTREDGARSVDAKKRKGRGGSLTGDLTDDGGQLAGQKGEQRFVVDQRTPATVFVTARQLTFLVEPPIVLAHRCDEDRGEKPAQDDKPRGVQLASPVPYLTPPGGPLTRNVTEFNDRAHGAQRAPKGNRRGIATTPLQPTSHTSHVRCDRVGQVDSASS